MKYLIAKMGIFKYWGVVYLLAAVVVFLLVDMKIIKGLKVRYNYAMCMARKENIFCDRAIKELTIRP